MMRSLGSIVRSLSPVKWIGKKPADDEVKKQTTAGKDVKMVPAGEGFYEVHQAKEKKQENEFIMAPDPSLL